MTTFSPGRDAYIRTHVTLAVIAMPLAMLVLYLTGTQPVWAGAVGGLAAVAFRGWLLYSEEMAQDWHLSDTALDGPQMRHVALADLTKLRKIGSAVQLVTRQGHKHLIKFQDSPETTIARINAARPAQGPRP